MEKEAIVWSPAGFWVRVGALLIDLVILNVAFFPIVRENLKTYQDHVILGNTAFLVIWGVYGALCNLWLQGTIGKKVLGLKVVNREDGQAVAFWIIFLRNSLGYFISSLATLGIGMIWASFNKEKKTLHDHIFATRVVKKVPVAVYGDDVSKDSLETS